MSELTELEKLRRQLYHIMHNWCLDCPKKLRKLGDCAYRLATEMEEEEGGKVKKILEDDFSIPLGTETKLASRYEEILKKHKDE